MPQVVNPPDITAVVRSILGRLTRIESGSAHLRLVNDRFNSVAAGGVWVRLSARPLPSPNGTITFIPVKNGLVLANSNIVYPGAVTPYDGLDLNFLSTTLGDNLNVIYLA